MDMDRMKEEKLIKDRLSVTDDNDPGDIEILEISLEDETEDAPDGMTAVPDEMAEESFDYQAAEFTRTAAEKKLFRTRYIMKEIFTYVIIVAAAFLVAMLLNSFVILNAHVPSSSMASTINAGDRLIGLRLAYTWSEPERGDIIIFLFPDDETQLYVKRIIGIPGDTVMIVDGTLYLNGEACEETYIREPMVGTYGPYEVPEGSYFVLGDNRNISEDARYWDNTYVTEEQILAKVWCRYSPSFTNLWN